MYFNIDTAIFIISGLGILAVLLPMIYSKRDKVQKWVKRHID